MCFLYSEMETDREMANIKPSDLIDFEGRYEDKRRN